MNEILPHSIPDVWSKQEFVQGFDFESVKIKQYIIISKMMDIAKTIFGGVVEPSYKKLHGQKTTVLITGEK